MPGCGRPLGPLGTQLLLVVQNALRVLEDVPVAFGQQLPGRAQVGDRRRVASGRASFNRSHRLRNEGFLLVCEIESHTPYNRAQHGAERWARLSSGYGEPEGA